MVTATDLSYEVSTSKQMNA